MNNRHRRVARLRYQQINYELKKYQINLDEIYELMHAVSQGFSKGIHQIINPIAKAFSKMLNEFD